MKNGVMMQYFEWHLPNDGSLWKKLKEDAAHLHHLGITAVWIPPAYKASEQGNQGYAAYDLYDLGEFDQNGSIRTKYGTKAELSAAVGELHKYSISVYLDAVLNHKIGADAKERFLAVEVDPENRLDEIASPKEIDGWTRFSFPGRNGAYSSLVWHCHHFTGIEIVDSQKRKHIYKICGENKHWSDDVDEEKGNFDFLMGTDIDHRHPEIISDMNQWGRWVSDELGLDGMRLDAIKHVSRGFIRQFVENLRQSGNRDFYFVGEYWKADLPTLKSYLSGLDNSIDLFDVPLHYNFYHASLLGEEYDLRKIFDDTLVDDAPTLAVTFVDNHDSQRESSLESETESWFKPLAYALILLRKEGYPCLFYGDYYGVGGEAPPHRHTIERLLYARKKYAYGEEKVYFDDPNVIGFVRVGDKEHFGSGLAVVISNKAQAASVLMNVGVEKSGEHWHDLTCSVGRNVKIGKDGNAEFLVPGRGISVWARAEHNGLGQSRTLGRWLTMKLGAYHNSLGKKSCL